MKTLSLLLLLISLIPISVPAEEEEEPEKEATQDYYILVEEKILDSNSSLTAAKVPASVQSTPASVGIVNRSLFETQAAEYLGDALKNISGVNIQSGFGTFDFFLIRGFDSLSSGLVLTDGAAEPEVTYYQLYNVDRIEVLKGPSAFLYGGNPLSGAVHLIRKQPLFTNLLEIGSSYGSFQTYRGTLDWNYALADRDIAFRFNAMWEDSNNYRDDKDNHLVAVNPSFTWRIDSRSYLNLNLEYVNNEYKPDAGLPIVNNQIPDVPRTRSYQAPFDVSSQDIYRARVDYEKKISDKLTVRNKFYYTDLAWTSNGTLFFGAFPDGRGSFSIIRTQLLLDDRQKLLGNQTEAIFSFDTGKIRHKLLTGFEISRLADDFVLNVGLLPPIDLLNPVETASAAPFVLPGAGQAGDTRSIDVAPYVVDQLIFSEKFQIFFGGRLDVIDYDDPLTDTSRNDEQFSPLFGAVYSPAESLSFYVNAGKAFAPPSTLIVGERQPEESTQFEAGAKKLFYDGKLKTSVALYHLQRDNIAIPDDNGVTQQTGDQRSRGVEWELAGSPARSWETYFSYAYNDSELTSFSELIVTSQNPFSFIVIDRSGNSPAFAPRHILNLWVLRDLPNGIRIGGGPRYVSSQFIAEDNLFHIDSYLTFDAYLSYGKENWRLNLNFKNLTDRNYETRGFGSTSLIPADPFAIYAGVDFRL